MLSSLNYTLVNLIAYLLILGKKQQELRIVPSSLSLQVLKYRVSTGTGSRSNVSNVYSFCISGLKKKNPERFPKEYFEKTWNKPC